MSDKELRRTMWQHAKGRRVFLLLAALVCMLPALIQVVFLRMTKYALLPMVPNPISILFFLLGFGVCRINLEQVVGKEKTLSSMFFYKRPPLLGTALLMALTLWCVTWAVQLPGSLLSWYGQILQAKQTLDHGAYITGMLLRMGASLLNMAGLLVSGVLLLPLKYSFPIYPEEGLKARLNRCLSLGLRSFGRILVFSLSLWLPPTLIGTAILLLLGFWVMPLGLLLFTGVLLWFIPYISLAEAAFVKKLFQEESRTEKKELRKKARQNKARN